MKRNKRLRIFLSLMMIMQLKSGITHPCGFPGRPRNGSSRTDNPTSRPGDTVHYSCRPGYTIFGDEERVCLDTGIWAGKQPLCELNLVLNRPAAISSQLWNYRASMAVDGNIATCSYTPKTSEQRWWQVDLTADKHVGSVALVINQDSYQEITIFVIDLVSKKEALYKPCINFRGSFQSPRMLFSCNEGKGLKGRYVFIRDDRKDIDYFGVCEVEVFEYRDELLCGEPEQPVGSKVTVFGSTAIYECLPGYTMFSQPNRTCEPGGHWADHAPQCFEVSCETPPELENGKLISNKNKYAYQAKAVYECNPGYFLSNHSLICSKDGEWSGDMPRCDQITCGEPPKLGHAQVSLLNNSAVWHSTAEYSCEDGYAIAPGVTKKKVKCTDVGVWDDLNITCNIDYEMNLPLKIRDQDSSGKESGPSTTHVLVSIAVISSFILFIVGLAGILIIKRTQGRHRWLFKSSRSRRNEKKSKEGNNPADASNDTNEPSTLEEIQGQIQELAQETKSTSEDSIFAFVDLPCRSKFSANGTFMAETNLDTLKSQPEMSISATSSSLPSALKAFVPQQNETTELDTHSEVIPLYAQVNLIKKIKKTPEEATEMTREFSKSTNEYDCSRYTVVEDLAKYGIRQHCSCPTSSDSVPQVSLLPASKHQHFEGLLTTLTSDKL